VQPTTPTVLSVDDFALRRGRRYGTILVDLERRQVVDLLPDRSAATLCSWLAAHPGIQVICRDRSGEYADGASRGAPAALQVADRFHLLQNLGEVTRRVLQRYANLVQQVPVPDAATRRLTRLRLDREASRAQTRARMRDRYTQIQALVDQGRSTAAMARELGLNWQTVHKYRALPAPPERRHHWRQGSNLARFEGYLLRRWADGARIASALWRALQAQGYRGAYGNVARIAGYLRQLERQGKPVPVAPAGLTPRQAVGVALRRPHAQTAQEQQAVAQLKALDPAIHQALTLLEDFASLLRASPVPQAQEHLDQWLTAVDQANLPEFTTWVQRLRQDWAAVVAGLSLSWSQGQTEGQITKLNSVS
jgi:transposase